MDKLRLVTFDVVKTLLRVKGSPGFLYSQAARHYDVIVHATNIDNVYKNEWMKMKQLYPNYGNASGMSINQWWEIFVHQVFQQAGYNGTKEKIASITHKLTEDFATGANWELLPNVFQVLDGLKQNDVQLGIISNFDDTLETALKSHNLYSYFDFFVTSANAHYEKPDPRMFTMALEMGKVPPQEAGHVGDEIEADYYGALNVGMYSFLLDPDNKHMESIDKTNSKGFHINSLLDILNILGKKT